MDHVSMRRLGRHQVEVFVGLWVMVWLPILDILTDKLVSFLLLDSNGPQDVYFGKISFSLLLGAK